MFEFPSDEQKIFLLPGDVVPSVERMFAFVGAAWPDAVWVDWNSDHKMPLREVSVETLLAKKAVFWIVREETSLANLEDPTLENRRHFGIGCHPLTDIVLEVEVKNERDVWGSGARACAFDAEVCLPRCWCLIVELPRNESISGWNQWSLQAAAQLRP